MSVTVEDFDPSAVPDPGVRATTSRRDQERGRAAVESAARAQVAKDSEQHPDGPQRAAEEARQPSTRRSGFWIGRPAIKVVEIYWQRGVRCKNDQ